MDQAKMSVAELKSDWTRSTANTDDLRDSVIAHGFTHPLVVTSDGLVIDGLRRLKVAQELGLTEVPVIITDDYDEMMNAAIDNRETGTLVAPSDHNRIVQLYEDTYPAMKRRVQYVRNVVLKGRPRWTKLTPEEKVNRSRDLLTRALGVGLHNMQSSISLWRIAGDPNDPYQALAAKAWLVLDSGVSPVSSRNKFNQARKYLDQAIITSSEAQRMTLGNAAKDLLGVHRVLRTIGHLSPDLRIDEIESWIRDLVTVKRTLTVTLNHLRKGLKELGEK